MHIRKLAQRNSTVKTSGEAILPRRWFEALLNRAFDDDAMYKRKMFCGRFEHSLLVCVSVLHIELHDCLCRLGSDGTTKQFMFHLRQFDFFAGQRTAIDTGWVLLGAR